MRDFSFRRGLDFFSLGFVTALTSWVTILPKLGNFAILGLTSFTFGLSAGVTRSEQLAKRRTLKKALYLKLCFTGQSRKLLNIFLFLKSYGHTKQIIIGKLQPG